MAGIRPADLARKTGESNSNIGRYLRDRDPSVVFITRFCEALDVSPTWLLLGQGPMRLGVADLAAATDDAISAEWLARQDKVRQQQQVMMEILRKLDPGIVEVIEAGRATVDIDPANSTITTTTGIDGFLQGPHVVDRRKPPKLPRK